MNILKGTEANQSNDLRVHKRKCVPHKWKNHPFNHPSKIPSFIQQIIFEFLLCTRHILSIKKDKK